MRWGVHLPHPALCKGKRRWVAKAIGGWQGGPGEGPNTEARNRGALRIIRLISLERQERILNISTRPHRPDWECRAQQLCQGQWTDRGRTEQSSRCFSYLSHVYLSIVHLFS